jgi:hypothetical protein
LRAFRVKIHLALLIEDCLLTIRAEIKELIFVNEEFWRPGRRHIKHIFLFLSSIIFISFLFFLMFIIPFSIVLLLILLLNHNILPFTSLVILELKVDLINSTRWVKIDPEIAVIEDSFN